MNTPEVFANLEDKLYDRQMAGALWKFFKGTPAQENFLQAYKRVQDRKLTSNTLAQADWRTRCSRRPQRNNHYDSWGIREKYVRCTWDDRAYTQGNPLTKAWSDLRLDQLNRRSSWKRIDFMKANGFRIRPRDKQVHI